MLKVQVLFHKDGDHLVIVEVPWWNTIVEWLISALFCPCHGVSGFLSRWDPVEVFFYRIWNGLHGRLWKKEQKLYDVPIESGCVANRAIFKKNDPCWHDECPYCWHLQGDAFEYTAAEEVAS